MVLCMQCRASTTSLENTSQESNEKAPKISRDSGAENSEQLDSLKKAVLDSHLIRNHIPCPPKAQSTTLSEVFKKFLSTSLFHEVLPNNITVYRAQFNSNGTRLLVVYKNGTAELWNSITKSSIKTINHLGPVCSAFFSIDGKKLISSAEDGTAKLWDAITGDLIHTFHHQGSIPLAKLSSCCNLVATISDNRQVVKIWNAITGNLVYTFPHNQEIYSISFSPDGTKILTSGLDNPMHLWDVVSGNLLCVFKNSKIMKETFSPHGNQIATHSDATATLWNVRTGNEICTFRHNQTDTVISKKFSPDGMLLATITIKGVLYIWSAVTGNLIHTLKNVGRSIKTVIFSPDGTKLAIGSKDCTATLFCVKTGRLLHTLKHESPVLATVFSPDSSKILITIDKETIGRPKIWREVNRPPSSMFKSRITRPGMGFSAPAVFDYEIAETENLERKEMFWIGGYEQRVKIDSTLWLWNVETGELVHQFPYKGAIKSINFSDDDSQIFAVSIDNNATIWNFPEFSQVSDLLSHPNINQLELLQAFELAIRERSRIHINDENKGAEIMETFKSFPLSVQRKLRRFIIQEKNPKS